MSDVNNPLFDNQREFLERQKEEYKNALMGDVEQIKSQGQEIGKKVAIAGSVVLAGFLLRRMFSGSKKKASKVAKAKKGGGTSAAAGTIPVSHPIPDYDPLAHRTVTDLTAEEPMAVTAAKTQAKKEKKKSEPGMVRTFMSSPFARQMMQQGVTLLIAYVAKKAAERMHSEPENNDIAAKAVPATVADPVVKSVSEKHAI